MTSDVLVMVVDRKVWFESQSLVDYLKGVQRQANEVAVEAEESGDVERLVAGVAVEDALRQIMDGVVLTSIHAAEEILGRRKR